MSTGLTRACAPLVALLWLAACSPRFEVYRVDTPDAPGLAEGMPTFRDDRVEVSFDFWSPGGQPYLALLNRTDTTLLFDLYASGVRVTRGRRDGTFVDFAAYLGGAAPTAGIRERLPELPVVRHAGGLFLSLAPGEWVGFLAVPLAESPNRHRPGGKAGRELPRHVADFELAFRSPADTVAHVVRQRVAGVLVDRLFPRELDGFERGRTDLGRYYFRDRHTDRDVFLATTLDVLEGVATGL